MQHADAIQKKRLTTMLAIDVVCFVLAGAAILGYVAAGKSPQPGSYDGRGASEPKDKIQTLTDPKLFDGSLAKKIKIPNLPEKPKKAPKAEPAA